MRFFIVDARLWRLPPRLGGIRMEPLQSKINNQLSDTSGWEAAALSKPAKWEAQEGHADLGMCLICPVLTDDQIEEPGMPFDIKDTAGWTGMAWDIEKELCPWDGGSGPTGWVNLIWWRPETIRGGWWEPGHGFLRGPCLWTVLSRKCSWKVAWHMQQVPLDLFASREIGRAWERDIISTRLWHAANARTL